MVCGVRVREKRAPAPRAARRQFKSAIPSADTGR